MWRKRATTILITGASSGIGRALALRYARKGAMLFLGGRNEERLKEVAELCREQGAEAFEKAVDVCDRFAMAQWVVNCHEIAPLEVVIANAGISAGTDGRLVEMEDQQRKIFDVNVMGVLNTINPIIPRMVESGGGHIAIMSSLAGLRGWPGAPAYCASKAAVKVFGESLRYGLYGQGVKVSVICPGFVESPMTDANDFDMPLKMSAERAAKIIERGIRRGKARIAFPFLPHMILRLMEFLPDVVVRKIFQEVPAKRQL